MNLKLIERVDQWIEDGRIGDWLHPNHGPFPDFAAIYKDEDGEYLSAIWYGGPKEDRHHWAVMVEGPDKIHSMPHTYYWKIVEYYPLTVSCALSKCKIVEMRIPKNGRPLRMIAKMSVLLFKKE